MANKKISQLPYIGSSKISGNTLVPLVTYFSATTGDTVHTYVGDFQNYILSGQTITGGSYNSTSGIISLVNNTGGTIPITGITNSSFSAKTNDILVISSNTISTKYNTTIDDSVVSIAVGGADAQAASIWKTYDMVQVLDKILFPTLQPTYSIPTLSLTSSISGTRQVGETISPTLTLIGTKNDAGNFTQLSFLRNSSSINTVTSLTTGTTTPNNNTFGYTNQNNPNITFQAIYTDSNFTVPEPSGLNYFTTTTYGGNSIYLSGFTKQDNKGVFDTRPYNTRNVNSPQIGSTTLTPNPVTITGIYPYFYGVSNTQPTIEEIVNLISGGTASSSLVDAQGTISITSSETNKFFWLAHNANNTTKTKWFVDAFSNGNISVSTDLFSPPTTVNVSSSIGYWLNKPFKIYITNYATSINTIPPTMELRNT
jgi:hypothetical protein